jgi:hypothetical protein
MHGIARGIGRRIRRRLGRGIGASVIAVAALIGMLSAGAMAEGRPPLVERLEAQLHRPLSADESQRVRALSAGAAAELGPIHARYVQDVAALTGQPESFVAALAPALGEPPPVPTIVPQLERRMARPLSLSERRRLIEADQANRRALLTVRDRLARRLSDILDLDYTSLRAILRESDLTT